MWSRDRARSGRLAGGPSVLSARHVTSAAPEPKTSPLLTLRKVGGWGAGDSSLESAASVKITAKKVPSADAPTITQREAELSVSNRASESLSSRTRRKSKFSGAGNALPAPTLPADASALTFAAVFPTDKDAEKAGSTPHY